MMIVIGLSPSTEAMLFDVLTSLVVGVVTGSFTYFFVNRSLRRRERTSDKFIAANFAEVVAKMHDFIGALKQPDEEIDGALLSLKQYQTERNEEIRIVTRLTLEGFLFDLRAVPTTLKAHIEKLYEIEQLISSTTALLSICSVKVARTVPPCLDQVVYDLRDLISEIERGLRAYEELETTHRYTESGRTYQGDLTDAINRLCCAVDAINEDCNSIFKTFCEGPLTQCVSQWPAHARKEYEVTLEDLSREDDEP